MITAVNQVWINAVAREEIIKLHICHNIAPTSWLDKIKVSRVWPRPSIYHPRAMRYDTPAVCGQQLVEVL